MAQTRSVDFLPEIFQTDANRQFLAATLDQLIQEPKFKQTQGFIGRTVGPGINPNDKYVVEPDAVRSNYQLEPGVVSLIPDTTTIKNTITYPGINDAVDYQGGNATRPDQLYKSDFYSWDPFIDFDTFVNFSQYFWLPNGPDAVTVGSSGIPTSANFVVTRENGEYTFSGENGSNPTLSLVRGGSYTFSVAQNDKTSVNYRVTNAGSSSYQIDFVANPDLTLVRGNTYVFNLIINGVHPFWIKTDQITGTSNQYNTGVSRNGAVTGEVTFVVPQDAPDTLYYTSQNDASMTGKLSIVDAQAGTGPGFWIQAAPGISGTLPSTPNISSRDVFGVTNNGEDLGTITFNVPSKVAQEYYFNLTDRGPVDLLTDLRFSDINNKRVDQFIAQYGGIDGNTSLANSTLVFINPELDAETGGWIQQTRFDPLVNSSANTGLTGSFDTTTFDQGDVIPLEDRYQVWQITYVNSDGYDYINLVKVATIPLLNKFTINSGVQWSNTSWFKDSSGELKQIPLLTAIRDTLYYQDATDPGIFGRINLIEQAQQDTLFINDFLGKAEYTSPNGVKFTNGLKVAFRGDIEPTRYVSGTSTLVCTGTASGVNLITTASTANLELNQEIIFTSPTLGGLVAGQSYYIKSVVNPYQFSISSEIGGAAVTLATGAGTTTAILNTLREYYVAGVGTAIELLPVTNFIVPETYVTEYDPTSATVEPAKLDYLTISRASKDLNAWTRSNRWFHVDVINATAEYNNTEAILDNNFRAKRPIIQFRPGIQLFNMGTQGKQPIDIIDFAETDAFSNIQGQTGYTINGYALTNGSRVIFAADEDPNVRNKIYQVEFIEPDTIAPLIAQPVINLTQTTDGNVLPNQSTVCLYGSGSTGITYWFNGVIWTEAQQKSAVQQAPLFDVYDSAGVSFGNPAKYPSSTFLGSKLFSYAVGDTAILDTVLQFPLKYLNINNVGDIVFENNLYVDTFLYVEDNVSTTSDISSGTPREYADRTLYDRLLGWQNAVTTSQQYQQFKFTYNGGSLKLDVKVDTNPLI